MKAARVRWLLLLVGINGTMARADPPQPLDTLAATARQYLEATLRPETGAVTIEIGEPDARLRLPACTEGLEGFSPPGARIAGSTSVGVRCQGPRVWRVHLNARITRTTPVLVWARSLPRGHIPGPEDVRAELLVAESLPAGRVLDAAQLVGMRLAQAVSAGEIARNRALRKHQVVAKGSRVTLRFARSNLAIDATGIALSAGTVGETIRVRNQSSERVVEAIVLQAGLVEVL